MPSAVQPVLLTADLDRLLRFSAGVAGAEPTDRQPPEGPVLYQGLTTRRTDAAPGT